MKLAEAAGIEPTHPVKGDCCLANRYIATLSYLHKLVDPTGIEPATDALQVLLAPEEHASPYKEKFVSDKK